MKLTKLDAATRQLNTAIYLWFTEKDSVSAHTLACSAYDLIHGVNRHRGGPELLFDSIWFKDERRGEVIKHFKREYNFFKHSDKDPDAEIEFTSEITESFLIFGCYGLEALGIRPDVVRGALNIYFSVRHPELLTEQGRKRFVDGLPKETINFVRTSAKSVFFENYKALALSQNGRTMPSSESSETLDR